LFLTRMIVARTLSRSGTAVHLKLETELPTGRSSREARFTRWLRISRDTLLLKLRLPAPAITEPQSRSRPRCWVYRRLSSCREIPTQ
jgi:hypothetical protein